MHRGDIVEITTIAGRAMTALILSDTAIAGPIGYVFIAPVLDEIRTVPSPRWLSSNGGTSPRGSG